MRESLTGVTVGARGMLKVGAPITSREQRVFTLRCLLDCNIADDELLELLTGLSPREQDKITGEQLKFDGSWMARSYQLPAPARCRKCGALIDQVPHRGCAGW